MTYQINDRVIVTMPTGRERIGRVVQPRMPGKVTVFYYGTGGPAYGNCYFVSVPPDRLRRLL